jgi:hypothetical protein
LPDDRPALYLGLGAKPDKSPLSLFLALREQGDPGGSGPPLQWQFSLPPAEDGQERWGVLEALDSTRNLFEPDVVEISLPADFVAAARFAQSLFWIRIIDLEARFHPPARPSEETSGDSPDDSEGDSPDSDGDSLSNGDSPDPANAANELPPGALPAPILEGLHMNTVWAVQAEFIEGEIAGSSDGSGGQQFSLSRPPVLEEAVWIDEAT